MKNLMLRKALLDREIHLHEVAKKLHVSTNALRDWMYYEWPEELQNEVLDFVEDKGTKTALDVRADIFKSVRPHRANAFGTSGGYASRVMLEVQEWELRREKEREGWY